MSATHAIRVRPATEFDLPAVRDIYNFYVRTSTCTFQLEPVTDTERLAWFRAHGDKHPVTVAEVNGDVVGWGSLSRWKERAAYDRSVEASVYVAADQHRRGIGRALLLDLLDRARALGHHVVIGGACTEHPGSIALQESVGFVRVGCFREVGFKFGRWLDVLWLQMLL
ncbi:MAG TPA: GNAT family N-acetyltransferase [Gemmataceae bacterium]|nr:GNAT family N-acetyltransferase [Gemmataceae bacterium]